jgi:shikimate kinase
MKHTGKSQHCRALAETLGWEFCDTDTLIQELDSTETGMRRPVRDIYREDGVDRFRQLEAAAFQLAAERVDPLVIGTGGGLCDNPAAVATTEGGLRVHLVDSFDAIAHRVFRGGIPAFLHTTDETTGRARLREVYDRRVRAYDEMAELRVDFDGASLGDARDALIATVEEYLNGR